jgi:predicted ATPase/DNA-binding SARP family transcriptional activator
MDGMDDGMDGGLELRVLGPVEVARGGRAIAIGGPKPRLVLAMLAARRGSVVSTDRLCDELWPADAPADPAGVLQSIVSRLRRLLRPEAEIVARPPGYVLEVGAERIDAGRFEFLCAEAARANDPRAAIGSLGAALACWRGGAFTEFADLDWARTEAVRLEELRVSANEDLLDARLATGEHAALVGELESLVAEYPLRERAWQLLIVALYRNGRTAEALRRASALRELLREELGLTPSPAFAELESQILNDDPTLLGAGTSPERRSVARRLPVETTALVGREDVVAQVIARVRRERLLTLTGPGGVGKTRLALRVATDLCDEFTGEVYMVELASVRDPSSTVAAIATAVDVQQRQHLSIEETLMEYLRDRRALLVLDNCEHLLATIAPLVDRVLSWCPDVTILATSREVLGLPGEQLWRVGPLAILPLGSDLTVLSDSPAVQLFVERARSANADFELGPGNADPVAEIVRRLDGLPLAIELAAARMRAMSPAALAQRLDRRFDLLDGAQTSMIERHRTLHDLVTWSHDLLDEDERRLFARLCVFVGSFGLDAAEAVCDVDNAAVLLANLVDKSMVQLVNEEQPRYRLLETLREFGADSLSHDERETVRERHAHWYLAEAEHAARSLAGPDEPDAVATLDRDLDNLRATHVWSIEHVDANVALRLVAALREYAFRRMRAELTSWADAAAKLPGAESHERYPLVIAVSAYGRFVRGDLEGAIEVADRAVRAAKQSGHDTSGLAERVLGNAFFYRGNVEEAFPWSKRMLDSARSGSPARLAHALYLRSVAATSVGDNGRGTQSANEALAAAESCKSPTALAQAYYAIGLAREATDPAQAAVDLELAVELARNAGNRWIEAFALTEVLWLQARNGEPQEALARYADVIDLWYRGGDWANQWLSLRHVYGILVQLRAYLSAATLHGALTAAGAAYALPFEAEDAERISALGPVLREQLGAATFATACRRGAMLRDAEIIEFVQQQIHALAPTRSNDE